MVQVKKDDVREAILRGARALFREKGYNAATLRAVSKRSKVPLATIYTYFDSKVDIIFALHAPWFVSGLEKLEEHVFSIVDPGERLREVLRTLWIVMPAERGMAANLLQALSSSLPEERYNADLALWAERKLSRILSNTLPKSICATPEAAQAVAHVLLMALDGFAISRRFHGTNCTEETVDAICQLVGLGKTDVMTKRSRKSPRSANASLVTNS
jgi:AcrR family transcriptional regulator